MACVAIRGLRAKVSMGCREAERAYPRMTELDLVVHYDMHEAIATDALEHGVDYNQIAECVERMSEVRTWKLVESFAADVARSVLELHARVLEVEVTVRRDVMIAASQVEVKLTLNRQTGLR